jgi:hypothetical protein
LVGPPRIRKAIATSSIEEVVPVRMYRVALLCILALALTICVASSCQPKDGAGGPAAAGAVKPTTPAPATTDAAAPPAKSSEVSAKDGACAGCPSAAAACPAKSAESGAKDALTGPPVAPEAPAPASGG